MGSTDCSVHLANAVAQSQRGRVRNLSTGWRFCWRRCFPICEQYRQRAAPALPRCTRSARRVEPQVCKQRPVTFAVQRHARGDALVDDQIASDSGAR